MKRKIISWLLAIACCLSLLPGNLVIAEESGGTYPSTTTVVYFTNLSEFPESANYAQVVTVTGAALTEVGGKTRWDNGLIVIEPKDGYTFDKAWYSSNTQEISISTVEAVLKEWGNAVTIPEKVNDNIKGKEKCKAIKIDTTLYNQIVYNTFSLDFKNDATGEIVSQKLAINRNQFSKTIENKEVNTTFDLFGDDILGKEIQRNDWNIEDFSISAMRRVGYYSYGVPEGFLKDEKNGKYCALKASTYHFNVTDKKTGIMYVVFINVVLDKDAPLKEGSIIVSNNNAIINYDNLSQAMINVQPSNKDEFVMKNIDFSFDLPEGAIIDWSSLQVDDKKPTLDLEVNKKKIFSNKVWTGVNNDEEEVEITFLATEQNGQPKLSISSDYGLRLNISFNIQYMEKDYNYSIAFVPNSYLEVKSGTYFLHPAVNDSDTKDIFNYLSVFGANESTNKQRFLDNVNNGIYRLTIPGVEEEDLKPFDGNVLFRHPGNARLNIYDTQLKVRVASEPMHIVMQNNTVTKYINSCNLKSLINGYWESSYRVECSKGIEYYLDKNQNPCIKKTETEDVTGGKVTVWDNMGLAAEFGITFSSKEDFLKNTEVAVSNMSETGGDSLVIDMTDDEMAIITAAIIKALMESCSMAENGVGNYLVITLESSSGNRVEWSFNSAVMKKITDKDIELNINVGNDVDNKELDKTIEENNIEGLKIGFGDNGELPGEVQIRLYLSDEEIEMIGEDSGIYLYYLNPNTQELVKEKSGLRINNDPVRNKKYISIPITHNSDFLLSTNDLDKNTSNSSGTISGGGISIVYTPAPTTAPTAIPVATPTVAPTIVPTAIPTAASTPVPTTAPVTTSTTAPTTTPVVMPTTVPSETETPDATPTVVPSVKNQIKKVKAVKKKVTVKKNKKLDVNFKVTATDNKKAVQNKVKATIKNKKIAKVVKTKVKAGKAVVTVKGRKKGKTVLKLNIGDKTAKTTIKVK